MSQKQTYTKEQLEAFRDCKTRKCLECGEIIVDCVNTQRTIKATLAADLLSANEEIERLREALAPFAYCHSMRTVLIDGKRESKFCREVEKEKDWCNGCKADKALKRD